MKGAVPIKAVLAGRALSSVHEKGSVAKGFCGKFGYCRMFGVIEP